MDTIYKIFDWDKELFLFLNSKHSPFLDPLMLLLSSSISWALVCITVICFILFSRGAFRKTTSLFLVLTIGFNAAINNITKLIVARPRPIHIGSWVDLIHAIEEYEASYSFFSGHSSNSFVLAMFSLLYFKNNSYSFFILSWATVVAYSRIYLGKHYPIDVLCGILFGSLVGFFGYKLYERYIARKRQLYP